ncbi:isoprenylcysteine carboxylmethyltransferase family protein [Acidithiobacillus ferrivorans]|nr:isoprenylcysteine carboxylmethyltransferase family protein [Acidithiobacillus ferrivorans]
MTVSTILVVTALSVWVLLEMSLEYFFRSPLNANKQDRWSSKIFNVVILSSIVGWALTVATDVRHEPHVALYLPRVACSLLAAGLLLRSYAVITLKNHFTVDLAIQPGHRLIRHGPYRIVRHPSYTGALLCFSGLALSVGYWGTTLIILIPVISAYIWRITKEEHILTKAFGDVYQEYCSSTYRLFPGII